MINFFIALQAVLLLFMLFHDWISFPPFNDIPALKESTTDFHRIIGTVINTVPVLICLILTIYYRSHIPFWEATQILLIYLILTIGTIASWWIPYYFGTSVVHRHRFEVFAHTHTFLPKRGDHVVPNTLHIILHLQVWACFLIALYYWIESLWH